MKSQNSVNVLFLWDVETSLKSHLRKQFSNNKNVKFIFPKDISEDKILKFAPIADIVIGWRPSLNILQSAKRLRLFINPGTGIKHHIEMFRQLNSTNNIVLVNGHGHAYSTAQHAVAMLLALMNRIIPHHNWMKEGIWRTSDDKDIFSASGQLRNREIGLLGYGAINKYVHQFLSGFENNFHILKRNSDTATVSENNNHSNSGLKNIKIYSYSKNNLRNFLTAADILIIAIPHTSVTENLIGTKELRYLGKKGLLINVARGIVVNEENLYNALEQNVINGAALDVWYNYNPKKNKKGKEYPYKFPFHKLNNVLLSPHRAASPFDDLSRWDEVIENINRFKEGRKDFLNIIDLKREY